VLCWLRIISNLVMVVDRFYSLPRFLMTLGFVDVLILFCQCSLALFGYSGHIRTTTFKFYLNYQSC
jgi:hypothetical protein